MLVSSPSWHPEGIGRELIAATLANSELVAKCRPIGVLALREAGHFYKIGRPSDGGAHQGDLGRIGVGVVHRVRDTLVYQSASPAASSTTWPAPTPATQPLEELCQRDDPLALIAVEDREATPVIAVIGLNGLKNVLLGRAGRRERRARRPGDWWRHFPPRRRFRRRTVAVSTVFGNQRSLVPASLCANARPLLLPTGTRARPVRGRQAKSFTVDRRKGPLLNTLSEQTPRAEVCRRWEARPLMELNERCLIYFMSERINFTTSILPPGGSSPLDPGHPGAHEVAYCVSGEIVVEIGDGDGEFVCLAAGDAVLIHDGVPHTVYNAGPEPAEMIWSAAPSIGRPLVPPKST